MNTYERQAPMGKIIGLIMLALFVMLALIGGCSYVVPQYGVYKQRLDGQAVLAHAQSSREVAVAEAKAKNEAAVLLAEAEVTRAKGVAQSIEIVGKSLQSNEAYLRYLWVTEVAGKDIDKTVVYVPTEANMPVLEAGRMPMGRAAPPRDR